MRISEKGANFIASFEKEVLHVYDDGYGYPTAGIGHRVNLPIGTKVTKEQSREWFKQDLAKYGNAVDAAVKVHVSQNKFDMLTSLCFNIGIGAFSKSSLLKKLNRGDYAGCADGFLAWNKSAGKVSKGLVRRRKEERAIFLTPDQFSTAAQKAQPPTGNKDESVTPDKQVEQPQAPPSKTVWERLTKWTEKANIINGFTESVSPISGSSRFTVVLTKVGGWGLMLVGLFANYWLYILVGSFLVGLAIWYLAQAKKNAQGRASTPTQEQSTTVVVK